MWASGVTYVDPSKFVLPQCLRGVGRFPGIILASKNTKGRLNHFHFHLRRERGAKRSRETRIGRGGQKETLTFFLFLCFLSPPCHLSRSPLSLSSLSLSSLSRSLSFSLFQPSYFFLRHPTLYPHPQSHADLSHTTYALMSVSRPFFTVAPNPHSPSKHPQSTHPHRLSLSPHAPPSLLPLSPYLFSSKYRS